MKMTPNERYVLGWGCSLRWRPAEPSATRKGINSALRLGIHTGLVVVGAMGGAGRQEQLALGETPNIAARIQGLAVPNTLTISEATSRLVQGYFDCEALGAQTLRGVADLSLSTESSEQVVPTVDWILRSHEDSHLW